MTPPLLNVEQVAVLLNCKQATLRKWVRDGEIEHIGMGRLVRFEPGQVDKFIEQRRTVGREGRKANGGKTSKR